MQRQIDSPMPRSSGLVVQKCVEHPVYRGWIDPSTRILHVDEHRSTALFAKLLNQRIALAARRVPMVDIVEGQANGRGHNRCGCDHNPIRSAFRYPRHS
jgi:hypothetical protein